MLSRWQFNSLVAMGILALLLVVANALLFTMNRDAQSALNQRQQFIQQTVPLEVLYRDIVRAVAELATKDNDLQMMDILTAQGLSVTLKTPGAAPAAVSARKADK